MPEYIGNVEIPSISPSGTFPLISDYGHGQSHEPQVAIHQFGSANAKIEQRFLLGVPGRRFTVRKAAMNEADRIALRDFWESKYGPYGAFTYNAPNDNGVGTTAVTCRFANEPLSWEFLSDAISSVGVTLIEIPSSPPTYTLNSTATRFPSSGLQTALLSQVQEIVPLIKIQSRESGYPAIYVSDRRCTVGSQLYQARLLEFDGISQSIGNESDQAQFVFGNADRVMRDLANDTDLFRALIEFSLFHIGTGIKLDLWKGEIVDWRFDEGSEFRATAADGIYELNLPYPTRRISRTCWKCYDDGNGCPYTAQGAMDYTHFPTADPTKCDKSYDAANGCLAHGMKKYFGGVLAEPQGVRIKDNSTGTWGYGRSWMTSVSLIAESIYDQIVAEIYTDSDMPVNCKIAAGRDESDFYNALGIVGEGPLTFAASGHKLDGQYHHGYPSAAGLRWAQGFDPAVTGDCFSLGEAGPAGSDWRKYYSGGNIWKDNYAAGLAFLELRRADEKGLQLTQVSGHDMQAIVTTGLQGWVWTAPNTRSQQTLTNPVWIVVNMMLRARGLRFASASTVEQYFDVAAAIAAAAICDQSVTKIVGSGSETQFKFRGVVQEEKPLRDWIQEILMNCLGYYTFAFGKLRIGIRINSSVVEAFTEGNILFGSLKPAAAKPSFNHLTANFADEEFEFATNSIQLYDIDHAKQIGGATSPLFLKAQINLSGSSSKSQAARVITTRLREELGGLTASQWKKARRVPFQTTVLSLNVEPGMVCSMTHVDMPAGACEFRVAGWRLNKDYSIDIEGATTVDEMYDLTVGPKPADVVASAVPVETIIAGPAGASGLQLFNHADDSTIPVQAIVLRWNSETTYKETIKGIGFWLSAALPAQGPFAAERAAYPATVLETGTCSVVAGNRRVTATRSSAPAMIGKVLCVYLAGASPDLQLSGHIITAQGANYLEVDPPFEFNGNFTYAIIEPWWDLAHSANAAFRWVPIEQIIDYSNGVQQTPPIPVPAGTFYVTFANFNDYGVGTKLTAGPKTIEAGATAPSDTVLPTAPVNPTLVAVDATFYGTAGKPATGSATLKDICVQWSIHSNMSDPHTSCGFGIQPTYEGVLPGVTAYIRYAYQNNSGVASNATVKAALLAAYPSGVPDLFGGPDYGWGPFSSIVGPVTSGLDASAIAAAASATDANGSEYAAALHEWDAYDHMTAAEAAKSAAESARDSAISAKNSAESAQGAAASSASAASSSASAASSSASAASSSASAASSAQSAAESAEAAAGSAASAASSSASAASSAAGAAASAQSAAETAKGLAETAKTDAESAQGAAEAARDQVINYDLTAITDELYDHEGRILLLEG